MIDVNRWYFDISLLIGQIAGVSLASLQESEELAEEKPGQEEEEEKVKEEISNSKASAIDKAEEGIAFNLVFTIWNI